jgi:hypothetical protein
MLGEGYDDDTFLDTLDGETDAVRIIDRLLSMALETEALAEAAKAEEYELALRRKRFEARSEAFRSQMLLMLEAMGIDRIERARATLSRLKPRQSVEVINADEVPSQLCKTTVAPDIAAIKKQLEAGETVPGAALVMGAPSISIRVK